MYSKSLIGPDLGHALGGLVQLRAALVLLGADVEEADARAGEAEGVAGVGGAHHRVLQEVVGVGADVGAGVEEHVVAGGVERGPEDGDGRAVDAGRLAEREHGQRHQRAGVAAGDDDRGLARLHRLERAPHAGALGVAQHARGLVVHGDDAGGVPHLGALGRARRALRIERSSSAPSPCRM